MFRIVKVLLVFSLVVGVKAIMVNDEEGIAMIEKVAIEHVDLFGLGRKGKYDKGAKVRIRGGTARVNRGYIEISGKYEVTFGDGRLAYVFPQDMEPLNGESVGPKDYRKGMKVKVHDLDGEVVKHEMPLYTVAVGDGLDRREYYVAERNIEPIRRREEAAAPPGTVDQDPGGNVSAATYSEGDQWKIGTVVAKLSDKMYSVKLDDGSGEISVHEDHLKYADRIVE